MMLSAVSRAGSVRGAVQQLRANPSLRAALVPRQVQVASYSGRQELDPSQMKLYVGNLSWETTRDDLYNLFNKYGAVSDAFVATDRETGRSRGFGFVTLEAEGGKNAITENDGTDFMGRTIRVNEAAPQGERPPGGGRGYGGGGRGYGGGRGGGGRGYGGGGGGGRGYGRSSYGDREGGGGRGGYGGGGYGGGGDGGY